MYRWARRRENLSLVLIDLGIITSAWLLALVAGFEGDIPESVIDRSPLVVGPPIVLQLVIHRAVGLYGPVWRYASIDEAVRVMAAVAAGMVTGFAWLWAVDSATTLALPVFTAPLVAALLLLVGCGGVRFQSRLFALERLRTRAAKPVQALIVGAGSPGAALAYELSQTDPGRDVHIVGFVDDDSRLHRRSVRGIPVLGGTGQLEDLCRRHDVDRIFIALPHADRKQVKPIVDRALRTRAQVKVLRPAASTASGMLQNVRDIDLSDLVGRQPAPVDTEGIGDFLRGTTVLVTGAGGSIGSEISRQVARYQPGRLLLLDRDETLLHDVSTGGLASTAETVLLDLCDRERMIALLEETRPDVVFHAAANKHVPILERYPSQAVATNVLSTWWLANAAAENGCQRFVHLSTDKAAGPTSVMGATKRAAEHVVVGVGRHHSLPYAAVRFGNVLGSRGSVVPTFFRQILAGGPVTVTSEEMTRYFMSIPEAVSLVLQAGAMADGGRIFLLDMGEPASILRLARQMIRLAGLRPGDDIAIEITGPRPGERLHERLHDEAEEHGPAAHPSISVLRPKLTLDWCQLVQAMDELERSCRDGDDAVRAALVTLLARSGVDCRLEPPPPPALGSGGRRVQSVARRTEVAVPEPVDMSARPNGVGLNGTARRRRLALLSGASGGATERPALPFARPARPPLERVIQRLTPSYESGQITNGALVRELEERTAERLRVGHVVAVSSCTSGLMLVVQALVAGRPGPVVLPSFTFSASAHAVHWNGRSPRFVDCDPATFQMDLAHAEAALDGASAVMGTHVFGAPCAPESVEKLGAAAGLPVVFDAAHAIGATSHERPIGGFGEAEIFSLTPTKPMVGGEGGLIATRDRDLAARLRTGRDYGNPGDYDTRFAGLNARMSEFHAAMALESLGLLDGNLARRRELAARYIEGLRGVPGIRTQVVPVEHVSTYKDFTIAVEADELGIDRNQLVAVLATEGIDTRNYFDPPVHRQQAYRGEAAVDLPVTDAVSRSVVSLPLYPDLSLDDIDSVVEVIRLSHEHADELVSALGQLPEATGSRSRSALPRA
ncbi:MAG TPA: aminotransferase class I/II-fold pyridoxal phosphate-dependent enzyme [Acidimicrobiales bacterium]|nr:aminotransferase class I/II-fold pyridoxal phosphate-dependent enzyme [Acidimicrobiales bacterium]